MPLALRPRAVERRCDRDDRQLAPRCGLQRVLQQVRRASAGTGAFRDIVGIEDQPAARCHQIVEGPIDAIAVDMLADQRRCAQNLQVDDVAIDAGKNAARRAKRVGQKLFVRQRREP